MAQSYPRQTRWASRPFIVTSYVPGPRGWMVAHVPSCCPVAVGRSEGDCDLHIHHYRRRKVGPQHLLTVMHCRTHDCGFTLYPPGYAPYRRQPVMRVAPDGAPIYGEGDRQRTDFSQTLFEAALDAKQGQAWARESDRFHDPPQRWWGTQGRHLRRGARLLGLAGDLSDRVRSCIAAVLSVPQLVLREGTRAVGYRAIGQAICEVLEQIPGAARRALHLLVCGSLSGLWGEALYWDAQRQVLERSAFLVAGTGRPR